MTRPIWILFWFVVLLPVAVYLLFKKPQEAGVRETDPGARNGVVVGLILIVLMVIAYGMHHS